MEGRDGAFGACPGSGPRDLAEGVDVRAGSTVGAAREQVSQVRQSQSDSDASSSSRRSDDEPHHVVRPKRVSAAMGQPAEHLPHW